MQHRLGSIGDQLIASTVAEFGKRKACSNLINSGSKHSHCLAPLLLAPVQLHQGVHLDNWAGNFLWKYLLVDWWMTGERRWPCSSYFRWNIQNSPLPAATQFWHFLQDSKSWNQHKGLCLSGVFDWMNWLLKINIMFIKGNCVGKISNELTHPCFLLELGVKEFEGWE